jgi:uncharacterized membrane protein
MDEVNFAPTPLKLRIAVAAFMFLFLVVYSFYYYPVLPETMATHFNGSGNPDGWSSKSLGAFIGLSGQVICLICWLPIVLMMNDPKMINSKYSNLKNITIEQFQVISRQLIIFMDFFIYPILIMFFMLQHSTNMVAIKSSSSIGSWIWLFLGYFGVWTVVLVIWSIKISIETRKSNT